ncbi:MAG: hypothetical protein AAGM38_15470 [Pseudomonadota bacterium]
MVEQRVTITSVDGVRPLGEGGQRSFEMITGAIARHPDLGDEHRLLFAEPSTAPGGGVEWVTEAPGRVQPITDLAPEAAAKAKETIAQLNADILAAADDLAKAGDRSSTLLATALRNAVEIPGEQAIFLVGDQPVIVQWAHLEDRSDAPKGVLSEIVPRRQPPSVSPAPATPHVAPHGHGAAAATVVAAQTPWWLWLGWLLLAIITAIVLYLSLSACGMRGFASWNQCPSLLAAPALASAEDDRAALQREIRDLERQLALADGRCRPQRPPEPVEEATAPEPEPESEPDRAADASEEVFEQRLDEEQAQRGELEFTLVWQGLADLDLEVVCPLDQRVSYLQTERRACGAVFDIDANGNRQTKTSEPSEHILWANGAPRGRYRIRVVYFDRRGTTNPSHAFQLRVKAGDREERFDGVLATVKGSQTFEFQY